MTRYLLIAGIVAAGAALAGIIADGIKHQSFGWER